MGLQLSASENSVEYIYNAIVAPLFEFKFDIPRQDVPLSFVGKIRDVGIDSLDFVEFQMEIDKALFSVGVYSKVMADKINDMAAEGKFSMRRLCEIICDVRANPGNYGLTESDFRVPYINASYTPTQNLQQKPLHVAAPVVHAAASKVPVVAPSKPAAALAGKVAGRSVADIENDINITHQDINILLQKLIVLQNELVDARVAQAVAAHSAAAAPAPVEKTMAAPVKKISKAKGKVVADNAAAALEQAKTVSKARLAANNGKQR